MRDKALGEGGNQIVLDHLDLLTLIKCRDMVQLVFLKGPTQWRMDYRRACLQAGICVKGASGENLDNTVVTGEEGVRSV